MAPTPWTDSDLEQMKERGISPREVERQLDLFRHPPPFAELARPATVGDGIRRLAEGEWPGLLVFFDEAQKAGRLRKFVPASGAATRMFQSLLKARQKGWVRREDLRARAGEGDREASQILALMEALPQAAFSRELERELKRKGFSLETLLREGRYGEIWDALLSDSGLNYAQASKGLIPFHLYDSGPRTPLEEHLLESSFTTRDGGGESLVHFTISAEHRDSYEKMAGLVLASHGKKWGARFEVDFSEQKKSLETIAVDMENQPFRDQAGRLLFRPAGHGALIENLNDLQGDIVFIKNIDNVAVERLLESTILWKKLLAGYLLKVQDEIFGYLEGIESGSFSETECQKSVDFVEKVLGIHLPGSFAGESLVARRKILHTILDRPLRVCGVVPNTGEPGGGPFWVREPEGAVSLQIVESSQVDPDSEPQQKLWKSSSHFNPVDLVCAVSDWKGRPFDLRKSVDPGAVFISRKSYEGR